MANKYDNELKGVLFKNDKEGNEKRPDYRGSAEIDGVGYWVSGWIKEPKGGGDKFMQLSFQEKETRGKGSSRDLSREKEPAGKYDFDDDIPFLNQALRNIQWLDYTLKKQRPDSSPLTRRA